MALFSRIKLLVRKVPPPPLTSSRSIAGSTNAAQQLTVNMYIHSRSSSIYQAFVIISKEYLQLKRIQKVDIPCFILLHLDDFKKKSRCW